MTLSGRFLVEYTLIFRVEKERSDIMQQNLLQRLGNLVNVTQNSIFYKIEINSNKNVIVLDNEKDVTLYLQALCNVYNV